MRTIIFSAVFLVLVVSASPGWTAETATPLVVEAWIKGGAKRLFPTRTVESLDRFDTSSRAPLDLYGGWKTKRHEVTGFFYPKKIDDRWWLIDPQGYRFFHVAVNGVTPGGSKTNRKALFQKFDSLEKWRDETTALLQHHSFNGTGNWSNDDLLRTAPQKLVRTIGLKFMARYGKKSNRVVQEAGHLGYPNRCIFVFDPQFEQYADQVAQKIAAWKNDPYLLGYFSDNELPFPKDLLDRYLQLSLSDPGHLAAKRWLTQQGAKRSQINDNLRELFRGYAVDRYLGICKRAIHKYDPNHLFLGPRFYGSEKRSEAIFRAAGKHLDVIAINLYGQWSPNQKTLRKWSSWSGRPLIITEWYAKGNDSGMKNLTGAGWTVATQQERGWFYQNFTLSLIESKVCVGWHWFKYRDNDPRDLTTDPSNRNSNKGIVTAAYEPWQPLLDAMKQLNDSVYPLATWFDNLPAIR